MAARLTTAGIATLSERLEAQRSRLQELRGSVHDTAAGDDERLAADRQLDAEIAEVDRALDRIEHGGYGICEACGRPIDAERLQARPAARFCVRDQAEYERAKAWNGVV